MSARTPARDWWQAALPHLDELLDLPATERSTRLAALHERDPALAELLTGLVEEHEELSRERFLEEGGPPPAFASRPLAGQPLGAYTLVAPIGEGGMGSVWLATRSDGRFERRAAVKFLHVALAGRGGEERFRREGRILARLTHPHVAALLDAGVSPAGQPYLVLEYVEGEPIDRHCDARRIDVEARLRLFLDVLAAVAHAHAQVVVHRDLKPTNVLVRADGCVKLLDFGIAKLLEDDAGGATATLLTREWGNALTPQYAAPEQAAGEPVTTATDVYALGVLLFVLLTGQHPAGEDARTSAHFLRAVTEVEAPRPAAVVGSRERAERRATTPERLARMLRGDLDTIVGKTLKKRPDERYASVTALADDVRRTLAHEPITARPDTLGYRTGKFLRRNPTTVALGSLGLVATVAGLAGTATQARHALRERDFAFRQLERAEAINDLNAFVLSDAAPSGRPFTVDELLGRAERIVGREDAGEDVRRAELLVSIGRQYAGQEAQVRAREVLERAYRISRGIADRATRARASCALGSILSRESGPPRAEQLIEEGLQDLTDDPSHALDRIFCLTCASEVARDHGAAQQAVARMEEAQRVLATSPLHLELLELRIFMGLAESYRGAGRNREALAAFEQASARLTALGRDETQTAGTLYNNWGVALYVLGRPLEAERWLRRAIELSSAGSGETGVSPMLLLNHARVLRKLARFDEAADYAERGYARALAGGDPTVVWQSLLVRSAIHLDRSEPERAAQVLAEVEPRIQRELPAGHIAFAALRLERARVARARGDDRGARAQIDEALGIVDASIASGRDGIDYRPLLLLRRAELRADDPAGSEGDARRALEGLSGLAEPGTFSCEMGEAALALGRALRAQGRGAEAREVLRTAVDHLEHAVGPEHPTTRSARELLAAAS